MARQSSYDKDTTVSGSDNLTGLDSVTGKTVQVPVSSLGEYYAKTNSASADLNTFIYTYRVGENGGLNSGGLFIPGQMGPTYAIDNSTTRIIVSNLNVEGIDIRPLLDLQGGARVILSNPVMKSEFAVFNISRVSDYVDSEGILRTNFAELTVSLIEESASGIELAANSNYSIVHISESSDSASFPIRATALGGGDIDITQTNTIANPLTTKSYVDSVVGTGGGGTVTPPTNPFNGGVASNINATQEALIGETQVWTLSISHNTGFTYNITGVDVPTGWSSTLSTNSQNVDVTSPTIANGSEEATGVFRLSGTYTETSSMAVSPFELSITLQTYIPWFTRVSSSNAFSNVQSAYTDENRFGTEETLSIPAGNDQYGFIAVPTHFGSTFNFLVGGFNASSDGTSTSLSGYTTFRFGPITNTVPTIITIIR